MSARIAALAVCETVLFLLLKKYKPELCPLCEISAVLALFFIIMPEIRGLKDTVSELFGTAGIASDFFSVLLKVLGLSIITELCADMCRDSGQTALAAKIEFFGTVSVLAAAMPVFKAVLQLITAASGV